MKSLLQNRWLWLVMRLLLGVVFLAASIAKIQDTREFVSTVVGYGFLPDALARLYGWVVQWVELLVGCALVLGVFIRFSAVLSMLLTLSFVIASSYALANATAGPCGCFGNFINLSHQASLAVDGVMLVMGLILLQKDKAFLTIGQVFNKIPLLNNKPRYITSLVLALAVVMGIVAGVVLGTKTTEENSPVVESITMPSPFNEDIGKYLAGGKPVLFIVYAEGCAPCEEAKPTIDAIEKEFGDRIAFLRNDYWQYETQMKEMGILNTPSLLLITRKNTDGTFGISLRLSKGVDEIKLRAALRTAAGAR